MSKHEGLRTQLRLMLDKARRSLASSAWSIDEGYCDFASSRAYYAVFYVMQAALLTKEMAYRKERAVIRAFNRDFVRASIFPKEFGGMISRLYRQRWIADEQYERRIGKAEAKADLRTAQEIARAVTEYLIKEGFIDATDVGS